MSNAESMVLRELEAVCPPDWIVLHSLWLKDHPFKAHAEVDFVIITDRAVLLVEVKGGVVWRAGDLWHFQTKSGSNTDTSPEGPFEQVRSAFYALRDHLADIGRKDLFYNAVWGYVVITPECALTVPDADTEIEPTLWMDLRTFPAGLRPLLDDATTHWRAHWLKLKRNLRIPESTLRASLSARDREELRDHIRPAIRPIRGIGIQAREAENEIRRLTREQYRVLDAVVGNPRVVLSGAAGTGKTVLAVEHALQLAEGPPRRKVLLVCYSRLLADHLAGRIAALPRGADVEVGTYHQVVGRLLARAGVDTEPPVEWEAFNAGLEDLVVTALDRLPAGSATYDAVVMDEAQDLMHPSFFQVIDVLLNGGLEKGTWLLAVDPAQAVFATQFQQELQGRVAALGAAARLTVNCRNTRQVAAYVSGLSGNGSVVVLGADGPEVQVVYYADAAQYRSRLRATVNTLVGGIDQGKLSPGDVVVLGADSAFFPAEVFEPGFFVRPVVQSGASADPNAVRVCSVQAFKGLEASCVVLVGLTEIDSPASRRLLYVGGSRAKSVLKILLPQSAAQSFQANLPRILAGLQNARRYDERTLDL